MKAFFASVIGLGCFFQATSQAFFSPDTVLVQNFQEDPSDVMLTLPTGYDLEWVNFNQDGTHSTCAQNFGVTPGEWYHESDLGTNEPSNNSCFTSCSFRAGIFLQNRNWLITPPIYVANGSYQLSWKSLALQGPLYCDGYKVLVSAGSNDPLADVYEYDTVFVAAQMVSTDSAGSLNMAHYTFSPGYIHANGFTDTNYYFVDTTELPEGGLAPYFHGRLEPHSVSLAQYAGLSVYIAFLHDSRDDYILQVDDIAIVSESVGVDDTHSGLTRFEAAPNPTTGLVRINWSADRPQNVLLELLNSAGQTVQKHNTPAESFDLQLDNEAPGIYFLRLQTEQGYSIRRLVKI